MKDFENLVAELAEDAGVIKPAVHPYLLSLKWLAAGAAYLAASLAASGVRPDLLHALEQPWFAAELGVLALIFISTSISAALLSFPDLHQKRVLALVPGGAFAFFLLVMLFAWRADSPPAPLPVHSFQCSLSITLVAVMPAAWTFYSIRRLASTHSRWAGSIAVLSAFSVGALWLRLQEVNDSIVHVIEWHYLPMLVAGIFGFWLGKRVLKW